ncbi:hypothetical protein ACG00Y_06480 [Roseateles sp. LYH14W]|uniref:Cellulose biosynthesis protein BcsS n=1 Tax=Pelomonas parva TaxID=3299032 RepID=A0ABW7F2N3_9BURK
MLLLCAGAAAAQTRSLSAELAVSSELTERGAFVGLRRPIAQAAVSLYDATGWSVGGALGVPSNGLRNARVVLRAAHDRPLAGDWQRQVALQYYGYPGGGPTGRGFDRWEAALELRWRDRFMLGATGFHYLHPAPGTPALQWALDAGGRWSLGPQWSAQAALGLARVRNRGAYAYGSLGLAWQAGDWRAEANLLASSPQARRLMPSSTPGHLSIALTRMF